MAENTTVKSAAETAALVDDNTQNPDSLGTPAAVARDKRIIHITLEVEGTTVTPDSIYDALDAAYPVVKTNRDQAARGTYIFNIGPA